VTDTHGAAVEIDSSQGVGSANGRTRGRAAEEGQGASVAGICRDVAPDDLAVRDVHPAVAGEVDLALGIAKEADTTGTGDGDITYHVAHEGGSTGADNGDITCHVAHEPSANGVVNSDITPDIAQEAGTLNVLIISDIIHELINEFVDIEREAGASAVKNDVTRDIAKETGGTLAVEGDFDSLGEHVAFYGRGKCTSSTEIECLERMGDCAHVTG